MLELSIVHEFMIKTATSMWSDHCDCISGCSVTIVITFQAIQWPLWLHFRLFSGHCDCISGYSVTTVIAFQAIQWPLGALMLRAACSLSRVHPERTKRGRWYSSASSAEMLSCTMNQSRNYRAWRTLPDLDPHYLHWILTAISKTELLLFLD